MVCMGMYGYVVCMGMYSCNVMSWNGMEWNVMVWYGMVWYACMHACMHACMYVCMYICHACKGYCQLLSKEQRSTMLCGNIHLLHVHQYSDSISFLEVRLLQAQTEQERRKQVQVSNHRLLHT